MTTLLEAVLMLGRKLVAVRGGTVDSGDTTSIIDSTRFEGDDTWNKGTAINISNSLWARITDFDGATGDVTVETMASANDADDKYALILPRFPLDSLIESINAALQEIKIPDEDYTSLDTVANQTEYNLPAGINKRTLRQVWVRRDNTGNVDYDWLLLRNWYTRPRDIGTQEVLVIESSVDDGYDLRLVYTKNHPYLDDPTDEISEYVPPEKWLPSAALYAMESRFHFSGGTKHEAARIRRFEKEVDAARGVIIPLPPIKGRLKAGW